MFCFYLETCPGAMSSLAVLKQSDLDLKLCLETFRLSPFSLETFLKLREECLIKHLESFKEDYLGIVTVIIRGMFSDSLRQAFTLFNDKVSEKLIFQFINKLLFSLIGDLRAILLKLTNIDRPQLTHMWHSTILAGEALKPFSADFSIVLEDIFVVKMFEIIKDGLNERLEDLEKGLQEVPIKTGHNYDLITTIALNSVVDAINQVRLCPRCEKLIEKVKIELENRAELTENIKKWAMLQFEF